MLLLFELARAFNDLCKRQKQYLLSALEKTIARKNLRISNRKELYQQLIFSISNSRSKNHIKSFKHAVSRTMKIVGDGNWRTPIGFSKYSTVGKKIFLRNRDTQANHSYSKASEIKKAKEIFQDINDRAGEGAKVTQVQKLREKLAKDYNQLTDDQRKSISNLIERLRAG